MILDPALVTDIRELGSADGARITRPGQSRVRCEGGEVKVEFLNRKDT